jgi:hypothetical protein
MGRRLEVYLVDGEVRDVRLDGESLWPTWFKIEWKETGQRSAKIRGERLSTNYGDEIVILHEAPTESGGSQDGSRTAMARPAAAPPAGPRSRAPGPVGPAGTPPR